MSYLRCDWFARSDFFVSLRCVVLNTTQIEGTNICEQIKAKCDAPPEMKKRATEHKYLICFCFFLTLNMMRLYTFHT